ncbi:MAG: hypothetical protein LBU66_04180, partial [Treponema sp.]|nr:hypothetical protein [Treponema sp.]
MKFFRGKNRITIALLIFSLIIISPVLSQELDAEDAPEQNNSHDFLLVPILETIFSGEVKWRPDWPLDIPPDGFLTQTDSRIPSVIELYNDTESFVIRRDREGRLVEFPFFYTEGYAIVNAVYAVTGALRSMRVVLKSYAQTEQSDQLEQSEDFILNIAFPPDFLPYSDMSPGGAFEPVRVNSSDLTFFVFIFESPLFLTETWYNSEGNFLIFCNASVDVENGTWRIRRQEIHGERGIRFIDYFFDSFGNITEIRFDDMLFSALYNQSRPSYWRRGNLQHELQWDTQNILSVIRTKDENGD